MFGVLRKKKEIVLDEYQKLALDCIESGENLFITGKAGTGKTEILKKLRKIYEGKKVLAVVAPTGVAAENAEGFTMHSFLRLPLKPYLPEHEVLPSLYQLDAGTSETLRGIDMLVIDEISMVRCDMLDATDAILRHYRGNNLPFGGVQLVMFGDLYQLCPVVKSDEKEILDEYYNSLYFFSSYALQGLRYKVVELEKIHRQENRKFINLLNNIRVADVEYSDIKELDKRLEPDYHPGVTDKVVTLMTHIHKTDRWNEEMFEKLKNPVRTYSGTAWNWFGGRYPVKYNLKLKVGARVMFQRNDNEGHQYVNGTMGWVKSLYNDYILVEKDNGKIVDVKRARWEQYSYYVDKQTKKIYTEVSGTYTQFPLKLAWAVSIHKSQGLTFNEVAIDASKSFAFGQVYVALSRCRTLKGIHLLSKIPVQKIIADNIVRQYRECIDEEGNVKIPEYFENENYELEPLCLNVSENKYDKIEAGELKNYGRTIQTLDDAKKIFLYDGERICVNKVYANLKKDWNFTDTNNGDCPFIIRQYDEVEFYCSKWDMYNLMKIDGRIDVTLDDRTQCWKFRFRIGNQL